MEIETSDTDLDLFRDEGLKLGASKCLSHLQLKIGARAPGSVGRTRRTEANRRMSVEYQQASAAQECAEFHT